jgi:hypothetical protein
MTTITAADEELNQKDPLQNKVGQNHHKNLKSLYKNYNDKSKDDRIVYKYSNDRKGPLLESIILAGIPMLMSQETMKQERVR